MTKEEIYESAVQLFLFIYFVANLYFGHKNSWYIFFFLAAVLALKLEYLRPATGRSRTFRNLFIFLLLGYVAINLISTVYSPEALGLSFSDRSNEYFYGAVIAFAAGIGLKSKLGVRRLLIGLLAAYVLWYAVEIMAIPFNSPFQDGRFVGLWKYNTNMISMQALIILSLLVGYLFVADDKKTKQFVIFGTLLATTILFLTKTRFTLLTFVFVAVPVSLLCQKRYGSFKNRFIAAFLIILIMMPSLTYLWWKVSPDRHGMSSLRSRVIIWEESIDIIADMPWQRKVIGYGNDKDLFPRLVKIRDPESRLVNHPHAHNVLIQTFLETGIVGVTALVFLWLQAFAGVMYALLKERKESFCLSGVFVTSLVTIAVMSQMDYSLSHIRGKLVWFVLGLSIAYGRVGMAEDRQTATSAVNLNAVDDDPACPCQMALK